jgi:hypothetical protein
MFSIDQPRRTDCPPSTGRRTPVMNFARLGTRRGYLTSNLRPEVHAPATPDALTARTLNHMRATGSALVECVEVDTVWSTSGDEKVSWSSTWMM